MGFDLRLKAKAILRNTCPEAKADELTHV